MFLDLIKNLTDLADSLDKVDVEKLKADIAALPEETKVLLRPILESLSPALVSTGEVIKHFTKQKGDGVIDGVVTCLTTV